MPTRPMNSVIEQLRRTVLRDGAGRTDGELLGGFIERRDDFALAALVERHGPMVWGVCRRLLNHHEAEDAFQATFLVFVRKAATVAPREMVGNWLYGVAHQTSLQARRTVARRRAREVQVTVMPDGETVQQDRWLDLHALLDREMSRLPDIYRAVLVLSDLEGRTRKEVARHLGVPEGTVAGRLARARAMLAKRLTQRGVAISGGALAAALAQNVASASVPASVVSSTIKAASLFAAGQAAATGAISVKVVALTEGVLKTMLLTKLRFVLVLMVAGLSGAAGLIYETRAADQPKAFRAIDNPDKEKQSAPIKDENQGKQPSLDDDWKVLVQQPWSRQEVIRGETTTTILEFSSSTDEVRGGEKARTAGRTVNVRLRKVGMENDGITYHVTLKQDGNQRRLLFKGKEDGDIPWSYRIEGRKLTIRYQGMNAENGHEMEYSAARK